jgi:hypothetical protein
MAEYGYSPLSDDEIRLLVILPEHGNDPAVIGCRIIHVHPNQLPKYEALSYCWGDPGVKYIIQVDGKPLKVRENLFYAFKPVESLYGLEWHQFPTLHQGMNFVSRILRYARIYCSLSSTKMKL